MKDEVNGAVQELLKLKEQYKTLTGQDVPSSGAAPARKEKEKKPAAGATASGDSKKETK